MSNYDIDPNPPDIELTNSDVTIADDAAPGKTGVGRRPDMSDLCRTIAAADHHRLTHSSTLNDERYRAMADAVLAAGWYQPRLISKPSQVSDVPNGSVLRTAGGVLAFVRCGAKQDRCPVCTARHIPDCDWFGPKDWPATIIWEAP